MNCQQTCKISCRKT